MSRAMNKPWHPETGVRLTQPSERKQILARYGMCFLCTDGHVALYAAVEKKKGKKLCSKIVNWSQFALHGERKCLRPVDQVRQHSLGIIVKRAFRAGADQ